MIDDLRHLPDDPFQILTQDVAGYAIFGILFLCWIADRMGWLA